MQPGSPSLDGNKESVKILVASKDYGIAYSGEPFIWKVIPMLVG